MYLFIYLFNFDHFDVAMFLFGEPRYDTGFFSFTLMTSSALSFNKLKTLWLFWFYLTRSILNKEGLENALICFEQMIKT